MEAFQRFPCILSMMRRHNVIRRATEISDAVVLERDDYILKAPTQIGHGILAEWISDQRQTDQFVSQVFQISVELRPILTAK
jgi:hypothetical protein